MRLSVVRGDPGYSVECTDWVVFFNGSPAYFVQTANEEEGWIEYWRYPGGPCGTPEPHSDSAQKLSMTVVDIDPATRKPVTVRLHGDVKFVRIVPPPTGE